MSNLSEIDINNVYRTCLTSSEHMTSLFEVYSSATGVCLAQMLMSFASIECDYNDGLPTQICLNCADKLNQFDAFRSKCLASNTTLRNYLNNVIFVPNDAQINTDPQHIKTEPETDPLAPTIPTDHIKQEIKLEINENQQPNTITNVNQTVNVIRNEKPYSCAPKRSLALNNLKAKPYAFENTGEKRYSCEATGEKPYTCGVCKKVFTDKLSILTHKRLLKDRKAFACTMCHASFMYAATLATHVLRHTGENPYACEVCGKGFSRKSNLVSHRRAHVGKKAFACTECECSFVRKASLTAHAWKHSGKKPYECNVCHEAFNYRSNLSLHMRKHE